MRRALLVGINHYDKNPLKGPIPDVDRMKEVISKHENGDPNFDCKLMISNSDRHTITMVNLKSKLHDLFNYETDVALFYFSGHGASTNLGSYLVTQDAEKFNEGVSLSEVITMANNSKAMEVIIILDCCYSGGGGNFSELGVRKAILREGVSILTASKDSQYAMERGGYGVFTTIIYEALQGGATDILGKVNVARIYNYVDIVLNSWRQRPVFKSHVSKMIPLRNCNPKIPLKILRKLPEYFEDKDGLPLSENYLEHVGSESGLSTIMSHLRAYHANGLLLPEDNITSLDECAEKSKSCKLTPLGIYYKNLVINDRI
ncbi:caspase family protein [Kordia algicida OT-1]|uniref:Putative peptidase protein (Caspase-1 like protein) n=1 Tax=Kordia algicida OT-1 TaxID=391587 RepID=A9DMA1_9FLAO|nr:caspase family protein [Kordia algicida]EDP97660.1 putative peptidase protein (caspase-1 like protein) [Kordia algicida OT-1]